MNTNWQPHEEAADSDLVARCLAGDTLAFAALIDRHRGRLERLLRVLVGDAALRDDVWQETLLRAYFHLDQLRDPARFAAWLCTIAANQARTQRNTTGKTTLAWEELSDRAPNALRFAIDVTLSPEERMIQNELASRVRQAITDLPPAEQEAVLLVYLEGMSHKEVAAELGATLSAVKVRVHRGRRRLQVALQGEVDQILPQQWKEHKMIRVDVHDIMLEMADPGPDAQQNLMPKLADILTGNRIILLKEQAGTRAVAIWVGPYEAANILLGLEQRALPRPLTYDLTKALLDLGEITLERAVVQRLHENTYYGNLIVKVGEATSEIDCRPSDAINLALRLEAPIFVAGEVMDQIAFAPEADGMYTLAASTAAHTRTISDPAEREKATARAQGKIWLPVRSVSMEQLVQDRERLVHEFAESLTTERARWLDEDAFRQLIGTQLW